MLLKNILEWAKAPEFIPKSRRILQESFNGAEFRMQSNWRSDNGTVVEVMQFPNFINRCTTIKHLRPINSQPSQPLCQLSTTVNMPQPIFIPHGIYLPIFIFILIFIHFTPLCFIY